LTNALLILTIILAIPHPIPPSGRHKPLESVGSHEQAVEEFLTEEEAYSEELFIYFESIYFLIKVGSAFSSFDRELVVEPEG